MSRLRATGLPGRGDAGWTSTDPDMLTAPAPQPSGALRVETPIFTGMDKVRLVFTDGVYDAGASDAPKLAGVEIVRLAEADRAGTHWAAGLYGTLKAGGLGSIDSPLAALNTAAARDGLLIRVSGVALRPLHIAYRQRHETSDAMLHHVVSLEEGAELTLLETGSPGARFNVVMEVDLAADATLRHVRPQGRARGRQVFTGLFVRVGREAALRSFTLSLDGALTRNEVMIDLVGDAAIAQVAGAALGDAAVAPFHHDDTVSICHRGKDCDSRQTFLKLLLNGASGVVRTRAEVTRGATGSRTHRAAKALSPDGTGRFVLMPDLRVEEGRGPFSHDLVVDPADTADASASSAGQASEAGAGDQRALSFLSEAIAKVESDEIMEQLVARIEEWVARMSNG